MASNRKRPDSVCKQCCETFYPKDARFTTFCSRDCSFANIAEDRRQTARRRALLRKQALAPRPCPICAAVFKPIQSNARLCGQRECRLEDARCRRRSVYNVARAALDPTLTKHCKQCKQPFTVQRMSGTGSRTVCCTCARANARVAKSNNGNHRHRARKAGVPYIHISRASVIARYGRKCWICSKPIPPSADDLASSFTLDHVVPLSLGGWHDLPNVRPAHHRCNSLRGNEYKGQLMLTMTASPLLSGTW
jgi:hypothetical protein